MPKVTDEYVKNKRKRIVDACYAVCLRKPIQMVTMTDVIEESGLSQILSIVFRKFSFILNRLNHNTPVKLLARQGCLHGACP